MGFRVCTGYRCPPHELPNTRKYFNAHRQRCRECEAQRTKDWRSKHKGRKRQVGRKGPRFIICAPAGLLVGCTHSRGSFLDDLAAGYCWPDGLIVEYRGPKRFVNGKGSTLLVQGRRYVVRGNEDVPRLTPADKKTAGGAKVWQPQTLEEV